MVITIKPCQCTSSRHEILLEVFLLLTTFNIYECDERDKRDKNVCCKLKIVLLLILNTTFKNYEAKMAQSENMNILLQINISNDVCIADELVIKKRAISSMS